MKVTQLRVRQTDGLDGLEFGVFGQHVNVSDDPHHPETYFARHKLASDTRQVQQPRITDDGLALLEDVDIEVPEGAELRVREWVKGKPTEWRAVG